MKSARQKRKITFSGCVQRPCTPFSHWTHIQGENSFSLSYRLQNMKIISLQNVSLTCTLLSNVVFVWLGCEAEMLQQQTCVCQPVFPHLLYQHTLSLSAFNTNFTCRLCWLGHEAAFKCRLCLIRAWSWRAKATSLCLPVCLLSSTSILSSSSLYACNAAF